MKNYTIYDWLYLLAIVFLLIMGLLVVYGLNGVDGGLIAIYKQLIYILLGVILFYFFSRLDYLAMKPIAWWLYILVNLLLLSVLFFGSSEYGARRWFDWGFVNFQPVETAKVVFIVVMAKFLSEKGESVSWKDLIKSVIILAIPVFLIVKQPDLGSSMVFVAIWLGMIFVSSLNKKYLLWLLSIILFLMPVFWFVLHDYQKNRILTFLDPNLDPYGAGYNVLQAQIAIGSGGWWGLGLGRGWQSQLHFLPVAYSDFAFAVLAEEFGLFGSLLVICSFMYLFWRLWKMAFETMDNFGFYLIVGVSSMLLFQVFVNIGMNIGVMPVTGIPLPFISAGGTSLVVTLITLGIIESIKKKRSK